MAKHIKALALATGLLLTSLVAASPPASANDYRLGVNIGPSATYRDLYYTRPGALFFSDSDNAYDYNSYSYDDRYHGPAPHYGTPYSYAPYYYAPGHPMYRYSAGGTLYYWPRANYRR